MKPIFSSGSSSAGIRLLVLSLIALLLVQAARSGWLDRPLSYLASVSLPVYKLTELPSEIGRSLEGLFTGRESLREENARLRAEALVLHAKTQKLASLRAENLRLRELLNSASHKEESVVVAEVVGLAADPAQHVFIVDKGSADGIEEGQAVIDADGLVGQVINVAYNHSRVMMVTDVTHALSVQVNRNGVRAIVEGSGLIDLLELSHVAATTDIKVGDLLVSSGLGGRFPAGYPVARVSEVTIDPGEPFATVRARPLAQLDKAQFVLLVFSRSVARGDG
ncbi:rod shape-determining protein MreC [Litorivivens sp.]|uniref:rod shape-determining protein MreC n=3 Tax=Litorivivens sp. TaxID=2020868 RepID=UPI003561E3BA